MNVALFDKDVGIIQQLDTYPNEGDDGLSDEQLKAKFDEAAMAIKEYLNETVVPALNSTLTAEEILEKIASGGNSDVDLGDRSLSASKVVVATPVAEGFSVESSLVDNDFSRPIAKFAGTNSDDKVIIRNIRDGIDDFDAVNKKQLIKEIKNNDDSVFDIEDIPTGANLLNPIRAIDDKKYPDNPKEGLVLDDPVYQSNRQVTEKPTKIPAGTSLLYVRTNIAGKIDVRNPAVFLYFLNSNEQFVERQGVYFNSLFDGEGNRIYKTVTVPNGADRFVLMVTGNADDCFVENVCISAVQLDEFVEYTGTEIKKLRDECLPDSVEDLEKLSTTVSNANILDPSNSEVGSFSDSQEEGNPIKKPEKLNTGRYRTINPIRVDAVIPVTLFIKTSITIGDEGNSAVRIFWLDEDENYLGMETIKYSVLSGKTVSVTVPRKTRYIHVEVGAKSSGHSFATECISFNEVSEFVEHEDLAKIDLNAMQKPSPPTKDMKMLVFGDSITETANITKDENGNDVYNPDFRYNWPSFVQYYLNLDLRNYAKSGATCRDTGYQWVRFIKDTDTVALKPEPPYYNQPESSTWPRDTWGWCYVWYPSKEELEKAISRAGADQDDRYADDQNLEWRWVAKNDIVYRMNLSEQVALALAQNYIPDIIVISIGTNDTEAILSRPNDSRDTYEDAMSIGSLNEFTYNTRTTMHKALRFAMWTLKNKYPDARCFIATPIQRKEYEIPQYTLDAIRVMANRYGFTVIDAYSESGIIRENEPEVNGHYLSDGLHPNEDGYRRMGQLYASKILNAFAFDNFEKERYYA